MLAPALSQTRATPFVPYPATTRPGAGGADIPPVIYDKGRKIWKINPRKENQATLGRPVKIVDGGSPVMELFS